MSIGERLRSWRNEKGIGARDIKEMTGISTGAWSDYENDKKIMGGKTLLTLYEIYNLDINWLLSGERQNDIDEQSYQLLQLFKACDHKGKEQILNFALFTYNNQEISASQDEGNSFNCKTGS